MSEKYTTFARIIDLKIGAKQKINEHKNMKNCS